MPRFPSQASAYRTVWRWHFYAGLFCLPFILWLSTTGLIYLFRPQIEPWLERDYAHVAHGDSRPPSAQVAAALAAVPGGVLNAYELPTTPDQATRVLVGKGPHVVRVYVNPSNARVLHVVDDNDRFMRVIFYLHGELLAGTPGSMLVELAACWTITMLLSGLYLWWPRGARIRGVLVPRFGAGGRIVWRDLHAVTGFWISLMALFLLMSGLPWAKSWGGMLKTVRQTYAHNVVAQDWTIGSAAERRTNREANTPVLDEHVHMAGMVGMEGMAAMTVDADTYRPLDRLVPVASDLGWPSPVLISPPSKLDPHWSVRTDTANRPQRVEATLDPVRGEVISTMRFADRPLLDRLIGYGVAIHEGQLFAPLNQVLGAMTALGLQTMAISALVLWWRRRPSGSLGAPLPHREGRTARGLVALVVGLGVLLPLFGVSLLAVLLIERLALRHWPRARAFLGLAVGR